MGGGGEATSSPLVNKGVMMGLCICVIVTEWYSIHFGYYFYILLVKIFGELSNKGKKPPKRLKGSEPGSIPRKNKTLPTVLVGPPRLKGQPNSQYTIGSDSRLQRFARGSDFRRSGCGNRRVNWAADGGLRARIHRNRPYGTDQVPTC